MMGDVHTMYNVLVITGIVMAALQCGVNAAEISCQSRMSPVILSEYDTLLTSHMNSAKAGD